MTDLEFAKAMIKKEFTCFFKKGGKTQSSTLRGVLPLVRLYEQKRSMEGFSAADRVVGKGAGFLYILLDVKELYAEVISRPALELLAQNKIKVTYGTLADNIINRRGNGICPFEEAVLGISEPKEAYEKIKERLELC